MVLTPSDALFCPRVLALWRRGSLVPIQRKSLLRLLRLLRLLLVLAWLDHPKPNPLTHHIIFSTFWCPLDLSGVFPHLPFPGSV